MSTDQVKEFRKTAKLKGKPLYEQGFWNVLAQLLSSEAYRLVQDYGGYESIISNWNAADAIPWFHADFAKDTKFNAFRNGYQEVPIQMAERFKKRGGQISCNTCVKSFHWKESEGSFTVSCSAKVNGETKEFDITCKHLVLAMPRRALELLSCKSPMLREISSYIESVTPRPLLEGSFKFQVQRVNDGAVAHRSPAASQRRGISGGAC